MDTPEVKYVPPQDPVYQIHLAFVPKVPPFLFNPEADPIQIVPGFTETESEVTEFVFNTIAVLTHVVVLQVPWART